MNFATPIAIKITTQEQADEAKKVLKELGYEWDSWRENDWKEFPYLLTDYNDENGHLGFFDSNPRNSLQIDIYNIDLVKALASMRISEEFHPGELAVMQDAGGWSYDPANNGCLAIITEVYKTNNYTKSAAVSGTTLNPRSDSYVNFSKVPLSDDNRIIVRKATTQEILNFYIPNKTNMNKEIIGYKLIKRIPGIPAGTTFDLFNEYGDNEWSSKGIDLYWDEKDVQDTEFFEPIYNPEETVIQMNDRFSVIVKNKQAYHRKDNITSFVKELVEHYNRYTWQNIFSEYTAEVEDVIFRKTGCQNNTTKLSDWKKVYDLIK